MIQAFTQEKVPLSVTIVVVGTDKAQFNQHNEGIQSNYTFFISNQVAKGPTLIVTSNVKNGNAKIVQYKILIFQF